MPHLGRPLGRRAANGVVNWLDPAPCSWAERAACHRAFQRPRWRGRVIRSAGACFAIPVAIVALSTVAVWPSAVSTRPPVFDAGHSAAVPSARLPKSRPTVAFIGDSTALLTSAGVLGWGLDTGKMTVVGWSSDADRWLGCGLVQAGLVRYGGEISPASEDCGDRDQAWGGVLGASRPAAVVVQFGPFDVADHLLPGDSTWRGPGDPVYDKQLFTAMTALADVSLRRHIPTIWLTSPHVDVSRENVPPGTQLPEGEPARMDRVNELLRTLARHKPGMHIVDLAGWVKRWPHGEYDTTLRPDGIHFTLGSARTLANWLGPAILRVLRRAPLRGSNA